MASIRREFLIEARPEDVWDAVRTSARCTRGWCQGEGDKRTRAVWTADLLPDEMAKPIAAMIDQGCAAMKKALERS